MFGPFVEADFPLINIGSAMYRRTESSPFAIAPSTDLAMDIISRLNAGEMARAMGMASLPGGWPAPQERPTPEVMVAWGPEILNWPRLDPEIINDLAPEPEPKDEPGWGRKWGRKSKD